MLGTNLLLITNPKSKKGGNIKNPRKISRDWIGQRVKIKPEGGMRQFHGHTGTVVSIEDEYVRVSLDEPVYIEGVGKVRDDLWMPYTLKKIRSNPKLQWHLSRAEHLATRVADPDELPENKPFLRGAELEEHYAVSTAARNKYDNPKGGTMAKKHRKHHKTHRNPSIASGKIMGIPAILAIGAGAVAVWYFFIRNKTTV